MIIKKKVIEENAALIYAWNHSDIPFLSGNENNENDWLEEIYLIENRRLLDEGLIKSYSLDFLIQRLYNYGYPKYVKNQLYFRFKDENKNKNTIDWFLKYINSLGYFVSQYKIRYNGKEEAPLNYIDYKTPDEFINKIDSINDLWVLIEPKFDEVIDSDNIEYLYHLTEKKYLDKIKKNGLIPKTKSKKSYHPDRIYIVTEISKLNKLINEFTKNGKHINDFSILKIDYIKVGKPQLYNDPNYHAYGYYIIDNVSPNAIVNVLQPLTRKDIKIYDFI